MRVGISTACFYPYMNTEDTLDVIKELGFNLCEVFLEADCETSSDFCMELRKKADRLGIEIYSVHAFSAGFEPYLFDRYERRKNEMENKFRNMCMAGKVLGARYYTFHGLRKTTEIPHIDEIASDMDNLCRMSSEYGIKLAWENVAWCRTSDPSFIMNVIKNMKEEIYFTLDIKQAIRSGRKPQDYLNIYCNRLVNVHINDAGYGSTCLLPGKGEMNLQSIVRDIGGRDENIPFIIELYKENYDSLEDLKSAKDYIEGLGGII